MILRLFFLLNSIAFIRPTSLAFTIGILTADSWHIWLSSVCTAQLAECRHRITCIHHLGRRFVNVLMRSGVLIYNGFSISLYLWILARNGSIHSIDCPVNPANIRGHFGVDRGCTLSRTTSSPWDDTGDLGPVLVDDDERSAGITLTSIDTAIFIASAKLIVRDDTIIAPITVHTIVNGQNSLKQLLWLEAIFLGYSPTGNMTIPCFIDIFVTQTNRVNGFRKLNRFWNFSLRSVVKIIYPMVHRLWILIKQV